jgi:hypothetical protein
MGYNPIAVGGHQGDVEGVEAKVERQDIFIGRCAHRCDSFLIIVATCKEATSPHPVSVAQGYGPV